MPRGVLPIITHRYGAGAVMCAKIKSILGVFNNIMWL